MEIENTEPLPERETFVKHREFLEDHIEPRFGLVEKLKRNGALSKRDAEVVEAENIVFKRNSLILNLISNKDKYNCLIEALRDANQSHVVNYIIRDGVYKPEFVGEWPLTHKETSILDLNEEFLVKKFGMDDPGLLYRLYASGVINERQRDFIDSKPTPYDKNKEFLGMLGRSSLRGYTQTIRCLDESKQEHIAAVLDHVGVVVKVVVDAKEETGICSDIEEQIVAKLDSQLDGLSQEERSRILNKLQDLGFIRATLHHSIALYFMCVSVEEVDRLQEVARSGLLREIIETAFNLLVLKKVKIRMKLDNVVESCHCARNFLEDMEHRGKKENADENTFISTKVNDLHLELLDIVLRKAFVQSRLEKNQLRHHGDKDAIIHLASVDVCWFQRIIQRKFKNTLWDQLAAIYRSDGRRTRIPKCKRVLLEESKQPRSLIIQLKSTDCLTDAQVLLLNRQRHSQRIKKFRRNNNLDVFHCIRCFDRKRFDASRDCHIKTGKKLIAEAGSNGGVAIKIQISKHSDGSSRSVRNGEIVQRLNTLIMKYRSSRQCDVKTIGCLKRKGIEIIDCFLDREAVVWVWCHFGNSFEKLRSSSESNHLQVIIATLIRTAEIEETEVSIDGDQFNKAVETQFSDFAGEWSDVTDPEIFSEIDKSVMNKTAYRCDRTPRGRAVIISNEHFETGRLSHRSGTEQDLKRLDGLFSSLQFKTNLYRDLTYEELMEILKAESRLEEHRYYDMFVLCLLTHGTSGHIYCSDVKEISIEDIMTLFDGEHCPYLVNKPKLFFVQANQGAKKTEGVMCYDNGETPKGDDQKDVKGDDDGHIGQPGHGYKHSSKSFSIQDRDDTADIEIVHEKADMFLAKATVDGYSSWRNINEGTFFVNCLVGVFSEKAHEDDLQSMTTEVYKRLHNRRALTSEGSFKQIGEKQDSLRRKVYFIP